MKSSVFIKELNRSVLIINSVIQGAGAGQFGNDKNNLLAGVMSALILRHCMHFPCIPNIVFSKQVGASQLLAALDNLAEERSVNPAQTLSVHAEDTLNYFLMFITNGYFVPSKAVIQ